MPDIGARAKALTPGGRIVTCVAALLLGPALLTGCTGPSGDHVLPPGHSVPTRVIEERFTQAPSRPGVLIPLPAPPPVPRQTSRTRHERRPTSVSRPRVKRPVRPVRPHLPRPRPRSRR